MVFKKEGSMGKELSLRAIQRYGWVRDLPDHRDFLYKGVMRHEIAADLPPSVDLRPKCPPVYDQGDLGSCTANACAANLEFLESELHPSRLFIYYNERCIEGTVKQDAGGQLRDVVKAVAARGACDESMWPYDIAKFSQRPPLKVYTKAKQDIFKQYLKMGTLQEMRSCLAAGFPFIFGFTVYDGFESEEVAKTGVLTMPGPNEGVVGGHAVMCVGYDDAAQTVTVRNSWGPGWGIQGYFTMPYSYITNPDLASDFWSIRGN